MSRDWKSGNTELRQKMVVKTVSKMASKMVVMMTANLVDNLAGDTLHDGVLHCNLT